MHDIYMLLLYYVGAIWRRRWTVFLAWAAICFAGWTMVVLIPDSYSSSAKIYVDTTNVLRPLLRGLTVPNNVDTQVRLMNQTLLSGPNIEDVIRKTDYDLTISSAHEREKLIEEIRRRTQVAANRDNVFAITFDDSDPERARDVVQSLLTIFVESSIGESRGNLEGAQEFIAEQIKSYELKLRSAEDRLASFKQDNMEILTGEGGYLGRAIAARTAVKVIERELQQATAQRNVLRQELEATPRTIASAGNGLGGPPGDTEVRILELEAQLRALRTRYTEKHPDVISVQSQLDDLFAKAEEQADAMAASLEEFDGAGEDAGQPNPLYMELKLRLVDRESQIQSLRSQAASATREVDELEAFADQVPIVEAQLKQLNRDYDVLRQRHRELLERRESASISSQQEARGEQVSYRLIEPPKIPLSPDGPNRPLFLTTVLVVGVIVGIGIALALVMLDTTFWSAKNLKSRVNVPVYGVILEVKAGSNVARSTAGFISLGGVVLVVLCVYMGLLLLDRYVGLGALSPAEFNAGSFQNVVDGLRGIIGRLIGN